MRIFLIWFFGVLAALLFGALMGVSLAPDADGAFIGALCGIFSFACARLWFVDNREKRAAPA